MSKSAWAVLEQLDRLFNRGTVAGLSEKGLLERFVAERDEAAFAALVARHGPMVLGVCRRILRDEHEVEDAFQATFLVLVRRAGAIRDGNLVSHWLHGVAHRVAVRARAQAARRQANEHTGTEAPERMAREPGNDREQMLKELIDVELSRLPASLRQPVVLCYLEGLTHDEAAGRLGWPVGTVRSRMARARDMLRRRLKLQGILAEDAGLTALLAREAVPASLRETAACAFWESATKQATAAALGSSAAAALAQGVIRTMLISKLKLAGLGALACVVAVGTVPTLARQLAGSERVQQAESGEARERAVAGEPQKPAVAATPADDQELALLRRVVELRVELHRLDARREELKTALTDLETALQQLRSTKQAAAGPYITSETPRPQPSASPAAGGAEKAGGFSAPGARPSYTRIGPYIVMLSPDGEKVALYHSRTGATRSLRLPAVNGDLRMMYPGTSPASTFGTGAGPLQFWCLTTDWLATKNRMITRIAALNLGDGGWYPLDFPEPVEGSALVQNDQRWGSYIIADRAVGFSASAKRWGVLKFPRGTTGAWEPGRFQSQLMNDGILYVFDEQTGEWEDLYAKATRDLGKTDSRGALKK